jgi:hypothetical protein
MSTLSDDDAVELLRNALPAELDRIPPELWSRMRQRIDRGSNAPAIADWVLVAALVLLCLVRPSLSGLLFLHF